jgi:hypothetical protein
VKIKNLKYLIALFILLLSTSGFLEAKVVLDKSTYLDAITISYKNNLAERTDVLMLEPNIDCSSFTLEFNIPQTDFLFIPYIECRENHKQSELRLIPYLKN